MIDNREEVFSRNVEYSTHYVKSNENRSRYNNWRNSLESQGYYHSKSKPGYWKNDRGTSKNRYVRDDSRFGRSKSINRERSQSRGKFQSRNRGKSQERPKSDLFKKVEEIEKKVEKVDKVEKTVGEILEMLKKSPVNMKFVEEEIVVDIKFMSETRGSKMIIDSRAPLSIVSEKWLKKYIEEKAVNENDLEY